LKCHAIDKHEFDVASEATAAEAPAVADAVIRHAPFHGTLEARQCPRGQRIDGFGDATLWLRKAGDVGEDGLVANCRLRGACPASHGFRQREGSGVDMFFRAVHSISLNSFWRHAWTGSRRSC